MFSSFNIGRVFGITIRVHALFLWMMLFIGWRWGTAAVGLVFVLFGVVLLHELGHSVVAQRYGIRVLDITFWPLGGMARMNQIPEDTKIEAVIAIAGPMVNFVLAALAAPLLWLALLQDPNGIWFESVRWFIGINLALGTFNLVPAFPMDGGRILRALLGRKGDWVGATEKAVHVGRLIAVFMGLIGIFQGIWVLPLIAVWLWFVGGRELMAVRMRHARDPMAGLRQFMRAAAANFGAPPADGGQGANWGAFGAAPYPPAGRASPQATVTEAEAPRTRQPARDPTGTGSGFSAQDVERLERFRGPLRQLPEDD